MVKAKTPWWRYVLTIAVFVIMYFLLPVLWAFLLNLTNLTTPRYMRNDSPLWFIFVSYIFAAEMTSSIALAVSKKSYLFVAILDYLASGYSFFVAGWNYALSITTLDEMICTYAGAVVYCIMWLLYVKESGKIKDQSRATENDKIGG